MSKKEFIFTILGSVIVFAALVGGIVYWFAIRNTHTSARQAESVATTDNSSNDGTSLPVGSAENNNQLGQLLDTQNGQGTSGGSATDTSGSGGFKQYEQYATSTTPYFADVQKGSGTEVKAGAQVAIYYKGYLTDGTLFDQTRADDKGSMQPFLFTVGAQRVIPGLEQGTLGMKVGGTRRIIIPPTLAYGEKGNEVIPPNSVLVFDVQLIAAQ